MQRTVLKNGMKVLYKETQSNIVTVNIAVTVGSNHEKPSQAGIAHFLEHMVFEGTKTRTCEKISSEIEQYGGEMNAYTSNEKTNYYIKIHKKHAEKAIEILADMLQNSTFEEKILEKEKNVVLEEINTVNDQPRSYQWILFEKTILPKPFGSPTYGTKETVKAITKKVITKFYEEKYVGSNMIATIVGKCPNASKLITKYFTVKKGIKQIQKTCSVTNTQKTVKEKKKNLTSEYVILGYRAPTRLSKDSYVFDVINTILSKGQSGKLFTEVRTKRGLTYDIGTYYSANPHYGIFALHTSAEKKKIPVIEKIFFNEVEKLKSISDKDLKEAKQYIEGNTAISLEDSQDHADQISLYEECSNYKEYSKYQKNINAVTKADIKKVCQKYLNSKFTKVMLV